jgi:hypothetical protein
VLFFKIVPAVKSPVLSLGDHAEIFAAIIERVVVYMVHFAKGRAIHNESVHADCFGFAVENHAGSGVVVAG